MSKNRSIGEKSRKFDKISDKLIEALEKMPGTLMPEVVDFANKLGTMDKTCQTVLKEDHPPLSLKAMVDMLPRPVIDALWTQQQEKSFQRSWREGRYLKYLQSDASPPLKTNHAYSVMWKSLPRLRGCFPTDIVGVVGHLRYEGDAKMAGAVKKPDEAWPYRFCEHLTDLAPGSPCRGNIGMLTMLIRYVVADRLDDRRKVPLHDRQTGDRFGKKLAAKVQQENVTRSLRELHAEHRDRWKASKRHHPFESDVMVEIERLNKRESVPTMSDPDDPVPLYPVGTNDLTTLKKAFDAAGYTGYRHVPSFATVALRAKLVVRGRTRQDNLDFSKLKELNVLRIPLLQHGERLLAKRRLELAAQVSSGPSGAAEVADSIGPDGGESQHRLAFSDDDDDDDDAFRSENLFERENEVMGEDEVQDENEVMGEDEVQDEDEVMGEDEVKGEDEVMGGDEVPGEDEFLEPVNEFHEFGDQEMPDTDEPASDEAGPSEGTSKSLGQGSPARSTTTPTPTTPIVAARATAGTEEMPGTESGSNQKTDGANQTTDGTERMIVDSCPERFVGGPVECGDGHGHEGHVQFVNWMKAHIPPGYVTNYSNCYLLQWDEKREMAFGTYAERHGPGFQSRATRRCRVLEAEERRSSNNNNINTNNTTSPKSNNDNCSEKNTNKRTRRDEDYDNYNYNNDNDSDSGSNNRRIHESKRRRRGGRRGHRRGLPAGAAGDIRDGGAGRGPGREMSRNEGNTYM
ncbi:hypothetical protein F5Y17DRAFT_472877 [Xylariaceae sp. FL0594]|nr:hypothetical protein F5Y17DRAFT_472877 [Xylariaceae sp. FL0594]